MAGACCEGGMERYCKIKVKIRRLYHDKWENVTLAEAREFYKELKQPLTDRTFFSHFKNVSYFDLLPKMKRKLFQ